MAQVLKDTLIVNDPRKVALLVLSVKCGRAEEPDQGQDLREVYCALEVLPAQHGLELRSGNCYEIVQSWIVLFHQDCKKVDVPDVGGLGDQLFEAFHKEGKVVSHCKKAKNVIETVSKKGLVLVLEHVLYYGRDCLLQEI